MRVDFTRVLTDIDPRPFPTLILGLAVLASVFSGSFLKNHTKLVEGELSRSPDRISY